MLEINGSHIAELNDSDLRTLIARLCEAELRSAGLSVSAVTAGGSQDAADGGLDVRVELPTATEMVGYVPRASTGFQVKVPEMSSAAIGLEMCPKGSLRPTIQDLASRAGAYIIVSSGDSTTDSSLQRRRAAMRDAAAKGTATASLFLDFYDRERVATWVRSHPGLVSWVRARIGQPVKGWLPYSSWATPNEPLDAEFILDEKSRFQDGRSPQEGKISIVDGMVRIREILSHPKGAVRLVGLSGLGKTRLAQALFDSRVGDKVLDPTLAIYTDLSSEPDPSPRDLVRSLVENRRRLIVVVDNCPSETHRALTATCNARESLLSLITIEYDVGDDEPEGTEVFRLEPASDAVIELLLERQAPRLSQIDRRRICEFSGGNARVALALARTIGHGEGVASLKDQDLFKRLFHQRQQPDDTLLRAAEACSLVYSFDGETLESELAELPLLANVVGLTTDQLYRSVAELRSRDLIQRRSKWRAVLPPALANRLARQALERITPETLSAAFISRATERLLRSFSRRLGYLHDCEPARILVDRWLSPGGFLSDINSFGHTGTAIFRNIAPVAPEAVLDAIEQAVNRETSSLDSLSERATWIYLLRSLAYEPALFRRAATLLSRLALAESARRSYEQARSAFKELFHLYLSGTHASVEQRMEIVEVLTGSSGSASQTLGLEALSELLEAWHFSSSHVFEFGNRPRDYGWHPKNRADIVNWYQPAIRHASKLALSALPHRSEARAMLAKRFRGLWTKAGMVDELFSMAEAITQREYWFEGWVAVRQTLRFDSKQLPQAHMNRLRQLEEMLRPHDLLQKARAYVLSKAWSSLDIADEEGTAEQGNIAASIQRIEETIEELGQQAASNEELLGELLAQVMCGDASRGWSFGSGLAKGTTNLPEMWKRLIDVFSEIPEKTRNIQVIRGFLSGCNRLDKESTENFLNAALRDPVLGPWFPVLQTSIGIDSRGVERLKTALQLEIAPVGTYRYLGWGCASDPIPSSDFRTIVLKIASLPDGYEVAIDIFGMRVHSVMSSKQALDAGLRSCGRELIRQCTFARPDDMLDYHLGEIINHCFGGAEAEGDAISICHRFKEALNDHRASTYAYRTFLTSLFKTQPSVALDVLVGDEKEDDAHAFEIFTNWVDEGTSPIDAVPTDRLMSWGQGNSSDRFPRLALAVAPTKRAQGSNALIWNPTALRIVELAPDRVAVLQAFASRFHPRSWSGSLADILHERRALVQMFLQDPDPKVVSWAAQCDELLSRAVERERAREQQRDESFE